MTDSPTWLRSTAALMLRMPAIAGRLCKIADEIELLRLQRPRSVLPDEPLDVCLVGGAADAATRVSDRRVGGRVG